MSASSAASSSLTRTRTSIILLSVLAAASGIYYLYISRADETETTVPATGSLHRSNAIHRRRRGNTATNNETSALDPDSTTTNGEDGEETIGRVFVDEEIAVDEGIPQDEFTWTLPVSQPYRRTGQNIVQLLFRVSEDATRKNAYVHRGCACNSCRVCPIRGIRYRCSNCPDFDLCEGCEALGLHNKTHIFYKIKVPASYYGSRNIQPIWYTGNPDECKPLSKSQITKLSRETGFERPEIDAYWEQWTYMANHEWREDPDEIYLAMDRKTFDRCLIPTGGHKNATPSLMYDRMFAFYDTNKDDLISFPEFLHGITYRKKRDQRWRRVFDGYDVNEDGYVDRKDFLRLFRSHYVLNREMHRDILENMSEPLLSTEEIQRVVSSRIPLSSAFGHDGRYASALDIRAGEGKTVQANGDAEVTDGRGAMLESGDDSGNREDAFLRPIQRSLRQTTIERSAPGYWAGMLNPPTAVEQLPDMVDSLRHFPSSAQAPTSTNAHPILQLAESSAQAGQDDVWTDDETSDDDNEDVEEYIRTAQDQFNEHDYDLYWPRSRQIVTDEDAEVAAGPGSRVADLQGAQRNIAYRNAVERLRLNRVLNERWKRRQFYTDEEDGATAPAGWSEKDEILFPDNTNRESSKAASRPSIHSRSSSKVRFAEELDDYDTRSNPSTSSRSVPERWGGMEIPDREKDAGKEVLYQVTLQAYNELLDPIFKRKEDLALMAAETRADREKYRHMYDNDYFIRWARAYETAKEAYDTAMSHEPNFPNPENHNLSISPTVRAVDIEDYSHVATEHVRRLSLNELLEATGYTVEDPESTCTVPIEEAPVADQPVQSAPSILQPRTDTNFGHNELASNVTNQHPSTPAALLLTAIRSDDTSLLPTSTAQATTASSSSSSSSQRDPTMPQFRPNSTPKSESRQVLTSVRPDQAPNTQEPKMTLEELKAAQIWPDDIAAAQTFKDVATGEMVAKRYLLKLWRGHNAEREKEERGGWGRLNFKEFEDLVKKNVAAGKSSQMEYLGRWIDGFIP